MTTMRINKILASSFVDGPGRRTVLYAQGCTIGCPGCQSRHTWPLDGGFRADVADLAHALVMLSQQHKNTSLSGGEITLQPAALLNLVTLLKQADRHIVVYSGFTWEQLHSPAHPAYPYLKDLLPQIDVLVDGPFVRSADDDFVAWRGSRNQRPIDVPASLASGSPVVLDWDTPVTITPEGDLVLSAGLADSFASVGQLAPSPVCGQVHR